MHVTGGQYKGRRVIIPSSAKPTLSKTREGVFNVLYSYFGGDFSGKVFLDMFAGSGIMSLEALSRGFKTVSIDINPEAIKLIKQNLSIAGQNSKIIKGDSIKVLDKIEIVPDVIYIDPPWESDYERAILKSAELFKDAVLVIESDKKRAQNLSAIYAKKLVPFKEKVYGRCKLDFLIVP